MRKTLNENMPYIKKITVDLFNQKFTGELHLFPYLNILSGVNGTGKTKVLQLLKQGAGVDLNPAGTQFNQLKVLALSPKRNAEKRAQENLLNYIKTTDLSKKTQELIGKQIRDDNYDPYPSFAELVHLKFNKLWSQAFDSNIPKKILDEFIAELNQKVVSIVLPSYRLDAQWDKNKDALIPRVYKEASNDYVELQNLSTGEQELLSLSFNIYLTKENIDIYLVDEPEVHLNWSLERHLFKFLKDFSRNNGKQVVVTTHSRIIFDHEFQGSVIFLVWQNGKIAIRKDAPKDYKEQIAGESIQFLTKTVPEKKTIYVEDNEHEYVIESLMQVFQKDADLINILKLSSGIIENLFGSVRKNPNLASHWSMAYFLVDGDNKPSSFKDPKFVRLKKYSIESYFFNIEVLKVLTKKSDAELKQRIVKLVKRNSLRITGKNKNAPFLSEVINSLTKVNLEWLDKLDCSVFFDEFATGLGFRNRRDFIQKYIVKAHELGILEQIFDKKLITFIKSI